MTYHVSIIRHLKIDIILGSLSSLIFFSHLFEAYVPWVWYYLLGGSIWFVYMLDHLIDGFRIDSKQLKQEHLFVWNNRQVIIPLMGFILVTMSVISFLLIELEQIFYGFILLSIVIFYFVSHHFIKQIKLFPKEFIIAVVYCFGTMLPALIFAGSFNILQIPIVFAFILLALTNVFVFSFFDFRYDQKNEQHNFMKVIGRQKGQKWIIQTLSAIIVLSIVNIMLGRYTDFAIIQILMTLILFFIIKWPVYFLKEHSYALITDAVFLIPALIVFYR